VGAQSFYHRADFVGRITRWVVKENDYVFSSRDHVVYLVGVHSAYFSNPAHVVKESDFIPFEYNRSENNCPEY